jgi:phosphoribosylformylglycinamidine (FGAM) synthase-like enzyme
MADLPIKELGDEAPEYDRPWIETAPQHACGRDRRRLAAMPRR